MTNVVAVLPLNSIKTSYLSLDSINNLKQDIHVQGSVQMCRLTDIILNKLDLSGRNYSQIPHMPNMTIKS